MVNTIILDENEEPINIIEYIKQQLGDIYVGNPVVVDVADYGVPQHRRRLITVLTKNSNGQEYYQKYGKLIPDYTHSAENTLFTKQWVTLREAIGSLPEIRAEKGKNKATGYHGLHKVPLLDEKKLFWVDNTPEGATAFIISLRPFLPSR